MKMPKAQLRHEIAVAQRLLSLVGGARALTISIMLKYEQYADILTLTCRPEDYLNDEDFFLAYQATRLLQKSKWLPTGIDLEKAALETFWAAESSCKQTNDFFRSIGQLSSDFADSGVKQQIFAARRKIRYMLRGVSPFAFLDFCGFGPGSDSDTISGFTSAYNKLCSAGSVTHECSIFLDFLVSNSSMARLFQYDIATRRLDVERVRGNRVTFVPKDAKTHRTIAVEPRWNVFFQKGMGCVLRNVLKRHGTDLDDQSRNQQLAGVGSLTGAYATIDLKSASDTISRELVRFLLPEPWVTILDRLRSKCFTLKGVEHVSEKWSSMGNGYTFELESLIFHALVGSVTEEFSVYGDDLIIPTEKASDVVKLLSVCGFSVNTKKSFTSGPFRESCGADFFNGVLCTPIYWKEPLNAEGTLRLVNQITRLAVRFGGGHSRDRRFRAVWRDLVYRLPKHLRYRCPTSIASGVHDSSEQWAREAKWGWDGWHIRVGVPKPLKFKYRLLYPAILSQFFAPSTGGYSIRDRVTYRIGTVFIPSGFEDLGPWS